MSEYGIDPRSEEGFFSNKREALVEELLQLVFERGVDTVLDNDIHGNVLAPELRELANNFLGFLAKTNNVPEDSFRELELALESGMALSSWTHGVLRDSTLQAQVKKSLSSTAQLMAEVTFDPETKDEINNEYEAFAQYADAYEEMGTLLEQESELVNYCAERYAKMTNGANNLFKIGYGVVRRATRFPYDPKSTERSTYNLNILGITNLIAGKFKEYCADDRVSETTYDETFLARMKLSVTKFRRDPYVRSFFTKGMNMALIDGICRLESADNDTSGSQKYHAMGHQVGVSIEGTFAGITARRTPTMEDYKKMMQTSGPIDTDLIDQQFKPGIYVILTNARWIKQNPQGDATELPISQHVLVPLDFNNQELVYRS